MGSRAWWAMKGPGDFDPPERPVMTDEQISDQVDAILLSWSAQEALEIAEEIAPEEVARACAKRPDTDPAEVVRQEMREGWTALFNLMASRAVPQAIAELEEKGYALD